MFVFIRVCFACELVCCFLAVGLDELLLEIEELSQERDSYAQVSDEPHGAFLR